jgi:hypothetical protein
MSPLWFEKEHKRTGLNYPIAIQFKPNKILSVASQPVKVFIACKRKDWWKKKIEPDSM